MQFVRLDALHNMKRTAIILGLLTVGLFLLFKCLGQSGGNGPQASQGSYNQGGGSGTLTSNQIWLMFSTNTQSGTNVYFDHSMSLTNDDGTPIFTASAAGVTNATLKNAASVATDANGKFIAGSGSNPTIPFNLSTNGAGTVVQRGASLSNSAVAVSSGVQQWSPSRELAGSSSDNAGNPQPVIFREYVKTLDRTGSGAAIGRLEFDAVVPTAGISVDTFYIHSDDAWTFNQLSSTAGGTVTANGTLIAGANFQTTKNNLTAPPSITVTASPFNYTNNDGYSEFIFIDAGTASAIAINGTTVFTAASDETIPLQVGEWVTVTYTVAPTMRKKAY